MKSNCLTNTLLSVVAAATIGTAAIGYGIYKSLRDEDSEGDEYDPYDDIPDMTESEMELYGVLKDRIEEAKKKGDEQTTINADELDALGLDEVPATVVRALNEDGYGVLMATTSRGDVYYISWRNDD